jgi:PAS domain S-box-containing protein
MHEHDTEGELRDSEERFRALAEAAREAIIIHEDGVIREVNAAFTALFGYTRDDVVGQVGWRLIVAPESQEVVRRSIQSAGSGGTSSIVCRTKSGERRIVESRSEAITYQRRPMRVVTMQDLTARVEAEEARRRSEEQLRFALKAAEMGTWDWDISRDRIDWSPDVYAMVGMAEGAFGGRAQDFIALVHPADRERIDAEIRATIRDRRAELHLEHRVIAANHVRWLEERGRVFFDDDRAVRMAGTVMDVTRQHELEEQLIHSQRMEAMGRLAGGVAHDFNNLLTIILSYTELGLATLKDPPRATASLGHVRSAAERAAALTRQLLIFARREVAEAKAIDLATVIVGVGRLLERMVGEAVRLTLEIDPDLWHVKLDSTQCEQVLMNLAVNARDAMPDGGSLRIRARNRRADSPPEDGAPMSGPRDADVVVLEVTDTGTGMDEEVRAHAFEPFFTTKSAGKGTGLGLPICHAVVTRARGTISVVSAPGTGTTFRITLPRCDAPETDAAVSSRPGRAMGGRETILLVEDDAAVRALAAQVLREQGYRLIVATSASDAFAQVAGEAGRIDLILTDVVMPVMGGPKMVEVLRTDHPKAKVLYMSGYTGDQIPFEHDDARYPLLPKPYSPVQLGRRVRELLDR